MHLLRNVSRHLVTALTLALGLMLMPMGFVAFWLWRLLPGGSRDARARRILGIVRGAFGLLLAWLELIGQLRVERDVTALPDGPCVLVAHHSSLLDTAIVLATVPHTVSVVRPDIWRRPILRGLFDLAAYVPGAGRDPFAVERMIDDAVDRLRRGFRVLVFPEGTRSAKLSPFGRSAFEIACRADVPVVPLAIRCDPPWLDKARGFFHAPPTTPHLTLRALSAVAPADHGSSGRRLRDAIYKALATALHDVQPTERATPRAHGSDRR